MQIIEMVKSHPVPFGLGLVVLLLLVTRGGSTTAAQSNGSALAQQSMANNTQLAQINAGTSVALGAQSVDAAKNAQAAALGRTTLATQALTAMVTSNANSSVAMAGVNATSVKNALDASTARTQMQLNNDTQMATITAGQTTAANTLAAQVQMHLDDNNNKLSQIGLTTQGNLALLGLTGQNAVTLSAQNGANGIGAINAAGAISTNQLGMNIASYQTSLPSLLQSTENMAKINGGNALAIVQAQQQAAIIKANSQADAQQTKDDQSWLGSLGSLASTVFSFF